MNHHPPMQAERDEVYALLQMTIGLYHRLDAFTKLYAADKPLVEHHTHYLERLIDIAVNLQDSLGYTIANDVFNGFAVHLEDD